MSTLMMEAPEREETVPFGARGLTAFEYHAPLPQGTTLCPERQVAVLPGGTLAVHDNDLMMTTGCWGTMINGNQDYHGDD